MKHLKKHPKQQRMEEMTFPIIKPSRLVHKDTLSAFGDLDQDTQKDMLSAVRAIRKEQVTMTGREYLRSINDDNGFTLMPRLVWRVVAVGVFAGAVIYFLSKAL